MIKYHNFSCSAAWKDTYSSLNISSILKVINKNSRDHTTTTATYQRTRRSEWTECAGPWRANCEDCSIPRAVMPLICEHNTECFLWADRWSVTSFRPSSACTLHIINTEIKPTDVSDMKAKDKGPDTCCSAAYRLVTSSALQSPKWQLIGMCSSIKH